MGIMRILDTLDERLVEGVPSQKGQVKRQAKVDRALERLQAAHHKLVANEVAIGNDEEGRPILRLSPLSFMRLNVTPVGDHTTGGFTVVKAELHGDDDYLQLKNFGQVKVTDQGKVSVAGEVAIDYGEGLGWGFMPVAEATASYVEYSLWQDASPARSRSVAAFHRLDTYASLAHAGVMRAIESAKV